MPHILLLYSCPDDSWQRTNGANIMKMVGSHPLLSDDRKIDYGPAQFSSNSRVDYVDTCGLLVEKESKSPFDSPFTLLEHHGPLLEISFFPVLSSAEIKAFYLYPLDDHDLHNHNDLSFITSSAKISTTLTKQLLIRTDRPAKTSRTIFSSL